MPALSDTICEGQPQWLMPMLTFLTFLPPPSDPSKAQRAREKKSPVSSVDSLSSSHPSSASDSKLPVCCPAGVPDHEPLPHILFCVVRNPQGQSRRWVSPPGSLPPRVWFHLVCISGSLRDQEVMCMKWKWGFWRHFSLGAPSGPRTQDSISGL